jgi:N-sulfoglucosamine sulfohydrolase
MYYPMRAVRTRKFKYIRNLAYKLDFPFASDLYHSTTWQGILKRGDRKLGVRSLETFLRRPLEELYRVEKDPHETRNLAGQPAHAKTLQALRKKLRAMQERTGDPWLVKYQYE